MLRVLLPRSARLRAAVTASILATMVIVWAPPAGADTVPFSDPNAVGYLGFCDKTGHQIYSGDVGAAPFVWTAVSSVAAPAGYGSNFGRGTLDAFQPIQNVDPGDWSGKELTAASVYSNAAHPMAAGTAADPALVDFTAAFPPQWDGLVQIRMYFTAPDTPQHSSPYPAAVVRVSGHTWTQVGGGAVPCTAGKATSAETLDLPATAIAKQAARSTPGAPAGGSTAPGRTGTSGAAGSSGGGTATVGPNGAPAALQKKSSSNTGAIITWVLIGVAVVAGAVVSVVLRRRMASR